jgi:two-component system, OmpR family, alkaline phosphatase synthesis response regulator PhoP
MTTLAPKIIVADDDQALSRTLSWILKENGYDVLTVPGGEHLFDHLQSEPFDLLLLDIMMPKVSGFEVCKRLKSDPKFADTPILMVTSLHEAADIDRGVEAGADDFLSKPIHRQVLLHRVKKLLEVRHIKNERDRLLAYIREVESSAKDGGSRH